MTDTLRDKLIQKGWVTPFNAATLVRLIEDHYADEPAVPEGREPAAVTGQPSDEDCWQWYTYCPEEGLEMYSDREQAQSAAQSIMGSYEVAAHSDGWHEDMELVSWGMLVPVEQAQVVECKAAEPNDEFDEWVKYELRPSLYGHQPAPPADGEVAELVEWLRANSSGIYRPAARAAELLQRQVLVPVAVPGEQYHEDMGPVTWWRLPVDEPPWVGTPNDWDWPGYHTHFTPAPPVPVNAHPLPRPEVSE